MIWYLVLLIAAGLTIPGIVKAVKTKNTMDLLAVILHFPFFFAFVVGLICGGSAINDAETKYELYQHGHYYLSSHGNWTEVPYQTYLFVLISEITGLISFGASWILSWHRNLNSTPKPPKLTEF